MDAEEKEGLGNPAGYRDAGSVPAGGSLPAGASLRGVLPLFLDTELWEYPGLLVRKREMVIGGKVFHIASVFQGGEKTPSTPTGKLLSHIDRQLQKDPDGL